MSVTSHAGANEKAPPLVLRPNKYSYTFGVPKNWDFSFENAQEYGARLVLFPKGGSFAHSHSIIYVTELCRENCAASRAQAIARTINEAKDDSPELQVAIANPLKINEGGDALVRILTGARNPQQAKEALAFIEHSEAIILVVLTSDETETWQEDYEKLREVVSGHKFFPCNTPGLATQCGQE